MSTTSERRLAADARRRPRGRGRSSDEVAMGEIERLAGIMERLRSPDGGCPWDREQTFASIAPYTLEEAYEVADAIGQGDRDALRDELGDLLFQVVFHAQMAKEEGAFDLEAVAASISDKLVRRHPHVFADAQVDSTGQQSREWEAHKAAERQAHARRQGRASSVLDGIPRALPALTRATKLQRRAARVGFDWPDTEGVLAKVREETDELAAEGAAGPTESVEEELGDLLFAVANLARHLGVDAETSLRSANAKFERRFEHIESELAARGSAPDEATLEDLERLWQQAKDRGL